MRQFVLIATCLFLGIVAFSQERSVSGKVTKLDGEGIPFVSVLVKGTTNGATTDFNGIYKLNNVPENATLVFTSVEFEPKEVAIGNKTAIDVTMNDKTIKLQEFVVTGYSKVKPENVISSVTKVKGEDIQKMTTGSIEGAMSGLASGVQVTSNSGKPGGGNMVVIHGLGSFGGANPLYLVDGMPVDDISMINSADIENMTILKDGEAGQYGAKGAGGVILITTKKGKNSPDGKPVITYETSIGFQQPWKLLKLGNANEWAKFNKEADSTLLNLSDSTINTFGEGTNWQKEVFRTAPIMNHQLSIRGGNEKNQYSISSSIYKQQGIVKGTDYNKYTFRASTTNKLTKRLTLSPTLNLYKSTSNEIPEQEDWTGTLVETVLRDPVSTVYNPDGSYAPSSIAAGTRNPAARIANNYNYNTGLSISGNNEIEYEINDNLNFSSQFGLEEGYYEGTSFNPKYHISDNDQLMTNSLARNTTHLYHWTLENILNWTKSFNDKHNINIIIGQAAERFRQTSLDASIEDLPSNNPKMRYLTLGKLNPTNSESVYQWALASYFARAEYNFKEKYFIDLNYRIDGSSRFAEGNRIIKTPVTSVGWILSKEKFMQNIKSINLLKIRYSIGVLPDQEIDQTSVTTVVAKKETNYLFGNPNAIYYGSTVNGFPDSTLTWQTMINQGFGFDLEMFKSKFQISVDLFKKVTSNMLVEKPIPSYTGQADKWVNAGKMQNQGIEIEMKYNFKLLQKVDFQIAPNFTYAKNKVIALSDSGKWMAGNAFMDFGPISYTGVGYPVASFFGYKVDGVFKDAADVANYTNANGDTVSTGAAPGDLKIVDTNLDGIIDNNDKTIIGNPTPKYSFGLNFNSSYKNWDLSIILQGVYGNKIFNTLTYYLKNGSGQTNVSQAMIDNYWTAEKPSNEYVGLSKNTASINYEPSEWYLEDGSYLRLRNIRLTYTIPEKASNTLKLSSVKFYICAQNLFTWTKYSGYDPEIGLSDESFGLGMGTDRANYPQARSFLGGVVVNF